MDLRRVLIVDDSPAFLQALRSLVARMPGIEVIGEAHDGEQAVAAAAATAPDIVLMDLMMPVMNGIAATRLIKERAPVTFVIVISITTEESLRRVALAAGADAFAWKGNIEAELASLLGILR
jgi:DNA-binding NarL/FixJ family response regulator